MTVQRFTFVKGWIDTAGRTRTWKLLDSKGKVRAEVTCKKDADVLIAALNMADLLVYNCAKAGIYLPEAIRFSDTDPLA